MDVINPTCCGIDVHNAILAVCLRAAQPDKTVRKERREFGTVQAELARLAQWLREQSCPVVAMESTGVYWKPVYHALRAGCEVIVGNPADMARRPGKKTDRIDADWISELCAHGLIRPSFIPPPEICALRDLTRSRVQLVNTRSQNKNRVHKILQDTGIKLACVASDIFGKSGRAMLGALINGEDDPTVLAQLARGILRAKIPQLELALDGQFTAHHASLIKWSLEQIDMVGGQVAELDGRIGMLAETSPMAQAIERLCSIPGVDKTAAQAIVAEIGLDMTRFTSPKRLAAWAGLCPGNNESAGKRRSGRTRKGNRWLRRVLVQCAWSNLKADTHLGRTFRRLRVRLGDKKTAMAVAHKILVIAYYILLDGVEYQEDRYDRLSEQQEDKQRDKAVQLLERLGYHVALESTHAEKAVMPLQAERTVELAPVELVVEPTQEKTASKPKRVEAAAKPKQVQITSKPKRVKAAAKPKQVQTTSKLKRVKAAAKPKQVQTASKLKLVKAATKPKRAKGSATPKHTKKALKPKQVKAAIKSKSLRPMKA